MRRAAVVVVALLFALVGCTAIANIVELQTDLEDEGYSVSGLNHETMNGYDVLRVVATSTSGDADRIAEVVWTTYPAEVDELVVVLNGESLDFSSDELTDKFGDRPESLGDVAKDDGPNVTVIVAAIVGALGLAALVVVVWLRGRRPPPAAPPGPSYQPQPYPAPPHPPQYPG